jgi:hypothetical protein
VVEHIYLVGVAGEDEEVVGTGGYGYNQVDSLFHLRSLRCNVIKASKGSSNAAFREAISVRLDS